MADVIDIIDRIKDKIEDPALNYLDYNDPIQKCLMPDCTSCDIECDEYKSKKLSKKG